MEQQPQPEPREIWVQKHPESDDDRVAIYDRDPAHPASRGNPKGELYIADRFPRLVAETAAVNQKLQRGPGGPPDLRTLREDEAQQITGDMEREEEERRAAAEEEALLSQQNAPGAPMPPEVAAYLANAGMVAMPMGSVGRQGTALPAPSAAPASGPPRSEATGVSTAVTDPGDDDDEAGSGRKPRGGR